MEQLLLECILIIPSSGSFIFYEQQEYRWWRLSENIITHANLEYNE